MTNDPTWKERVRDLIAREVCRVQLNGGDPEQPAMRWNGAETESQSFPAWHDYRAEADAILALFSRPDSPVRLVPVEPTIEMEIAGGDEAAKQYSNGIVPVEPNPIYRAMLKALETSDE